MTINNITTAILLHPSSGNHQISSLPLHLSRLSHFFSLGLLPPLSLVLSSLLLFFFFSFPFLLFPSPASPSGLSNISRTAFIRTCLFLVWYSGQRTSRLSAPLFARILRYPFCTDDGLRTTKLTDRIHPNLSSVRIPTWRQAVRDKNVFAHLFREALTNPVFFFFSLIFLYFFYFAALSSGTKSFLELKKK